MSKVDRHPGPMPEKPKESLATFDRKSGTEATRVLAWREEQFKLLGVSDKMSVVLAKLSIDLDEFRSLVARGCEPKLAARILLPDDYIKTS